MTQTTLPRIDPQFAGTLLPYLEADLRYVADVFDKSFWPPEPLTRDDEELLTELIEVGANDGLEIRGMIDVCRRFGFDPGS